MKTFKTEEVDGRRFEDIEDARRSIAVLSRPSTIPNVFTPLSAAAHHTSSKPTSPWQKATHLK